MRKSVVLLLLAGVVATPAVAQDATFQGARIEGIVGWDRVNVEGEGANGVTYGAAVGYDLQRGRAVFGIEGEVTDSSADECISGTVIAGDQLCAGAGRDLYVGGRAGAAVSRNLLLYAKAGYTNGRVRLDYDDGTAATTSDFNIGRNLDGVRLGAGAEYALSQNAFLKTEYRYSNYEDGFSRHQVVGGFGFRF
ncbi:porin family protein [Sphingosinicella sp. LHD-64]|uniref:outer membrane protein n=1 Tax=Sphingosinicella sp. LHD-64 TaxID=3072139 RepID=UPI00280FD5B2|nr:porin family protein [Sphingosinicella sp. LHD-64]MDQ8758016.1 porin family protein [Sphingosinicella sp. LHD-64]